MHLNTQVSIADLSFKLKKDELEKLSSQLTEVCREITLLNKELAARYAIVSTAGRFAPSAVSYSFTCDVQAKIGALERQLNEWLDLKKKLELQRDKAICHYALAKRLNAQKLNQDLIFAKKSDRLQSDEFNTWNHRNSSLDGENAWFRPAVCLDLKNNKI